MDCEDHRVRLDAAKVIHASMSETMKTRYSIGVKNSLDLDLGDEKIWK